MSTYTYTDPVAEFYAAEAANTYIPHSVQQFMLDWVYAVINANTPHMQDVRGDMPPIEESRRDQNQHAALCLHAWVVKDQMYDLSTGYTMSCLDYTEARQEYEGMDESDESSAYYDIAVSAEYHVRPDPTDNQSPCTIRHDAKVWHAPYVKLQVALRSADFPLRMRPHRDLLLQGQQYAVAHDSTRLTVFTAYIQYKDGRSLSSRVLEKLTRHALEFIR